MHYTYNLYSILNLHIYIYNDVLTFTKYFRGEKAVGKKKGSRPAGYKGRQRSYGASLTGYTLESRSIYKGVFGDPITYEIVSIRNYYNDIFF